MDICFITVVFLFLSQETSVHLPYIWAYFPKSFWSKDAICCDFPHLCSHCSVSDRFREHRRRTPYKQQGWWRKTKLPFKFLRLHPLSVTHGMNSPRETQSPPVSSSSHKEASELISPCRCMEIWEEGAVQELFLSLSFCYLAIETQTLLLQVQKASSSSSKLPAGSIEFHSVLHQWHEYPSINCWHNKIWMSETGCH